MDLSLMAKADSQSVRFWVAMPDEHVPSFKNRKRAIKDKNTKKLRTLTEPAVKERMTRIEEGILSALYSMYQTIDAVTDSECRKRLRTVLFELSDDSLKEIPEFMFGLKRVSKGNEGVEIIITKL